MEELTCLLALKDIKGIGDTIARILLEQFGSAQAVFSAENDKLLEIKGVNRSVAGSIKDFSDWGR